jgi:hypothetical protein
MDNAIAAAIIGGAFGLAVVLIGGQVNRYLAWRTWDRDRATEAYVDFLERAQDSAELADRVARGHKTENAAKREQLRLLLRAEIREDLLAALLLASWPSPFVRWSWNSRAMPT